MQRADLQIVPQQDSILIRLVGEWKIENELPGTEALQALLHPDIRRLLFDAESLRSWDTGLLTFLSKVKVVSAASGLAIEWQGLPRGVQRLLSLSASVPYRKEALKESARPTVLDRFGNPVIVFSRSFLAATDFLGEIIVAFARLLRGKARFRRSDLLLIIQQSGAQALPIVSLVSMLVGIILAFIAAMQLRIFGAQIYVASLVGIAMTRALAAVMTAVIMSGRTGASFAAELGTMQVNEEVDALKTLGIPPVEFLVLPRMIALSLMMPLLSLYADLMGILGGFVIGVTMLDLNFMEYYNKTKETVSMNHFWIGLLSAAVFGILVAFFGCLRGMRCGRSASAVGEATTSAVVASIVSIVVATAVITAICNVLNI